LLDIETGEKQLITDDFLYSLNDITSIWQMDGSMFAFIVRNEGGTTLYVANNEGVVVGRITGYKERPWNLRGFDNAEIIWVEGWYSGGRMYSGATYQTLVNEQVTSKRDGDYLDNVEQGKVSPDGNFFLKKTILLQMKIALHTYI